MTYSNKLERTNEKIERAAIACFYRQPFENVTMENIAAEAKISKKTLYNHYPNKLAIFATIFEKKMNTLYDLEYEALSKCDSARAVYTTLFSLLVKYTQEDTIFSSVFWTFKMRSTDMSDIPENVVQRIKELNKRLIDMPAQFLAKFPAPAPFGAYSPEVQMHFLSALNKGVIMQLSQDKSISSSKEMDELLLLAKDILDFCTG